MSALKYRCWFLSFSSKEDGFPVGLGFLEAFKVYLILNPLLVFDRDPLHFKSKIKQERSGPNKCSWRKFFFEIASVNFVEIRIQT